MSDIGEPPHRRAARGMMGDRPIGRPSRFVGSGRGITITVLSLVAVLLVARGATMLWMVENLWAWWHAPFSVYSPVQPAVAPPRWDRRLANRRASGKPAAAFGPDSYPEAALRAGVEGRTVATLAVDRSGRPTRCVVMVSSGSGDLDRATCEVAIARVRLQPARDSEGRPIASTYELPVRWVLPRQ